VDLVVSSTALASASEMEPRGNLNCPPPPNLVRRDNHSYRRFFARILLTISAVVVLFWAIAIAHANNTLPQCTGTNTIGIDEMTDALTAKQSPVAPVATEVTKAFESMYKELRIITKLTEKLIDDCSKDKKCAEAETPMSMLDATQQWASHSLMLAQDENRTLAKINERVTATGQALEGLWKAAEEPKSGSIEYLFKAPANWGWCRFWQVFGHCKDGLDDDPNLLPFLSNLNCSRCIKWQVSASPGSSKACLDKLAQPRYLFLSRFDAAVKFSFDAMLTVRRNDAILAVLWKILESRAFAFRNYMQRASLLAPEYKHWLEPQLRLCNAAHVRWVEAMDRYAVETTRVSLSAENRKIEAGKASTPRAMVKMLRDMTLPYLSLRMPVPVVPHQEIKLMPIMTTIGKPAWMQAAISGANNVWYCVVEYAMWRSQV
jgi:hypothetical protein